MILNMVGGGGPSAEDGNNIKYPVVLPSTENKLYVEKSISDISSAIDAGPLTVAEMPAAILGLKESGLISTNIVIASAEYTVTPWE